MNSQNGTLAGVFENGIRLSLRRDNVVESQQDDAQAKTKTARPALTTEERSRIDRRKTLEMALARTQAELRAACHAAHRDMLRLKLEALQAELGTL
jgi:hypothetical protein